jgi:hypothetical protein
MDLVRLEEFSEIVRHESAALIRADDERLESAMEAHVCAHLGREGVEGGSRDSGRHMVGRVKAAIARSSVHDASVAGETMEDARKERAGKPARTNLKKHELENIKAARGIVKRAANQAKQHY